MINEINKSFQIFLNITIQHIKLLTTDIKAYNHPWPEKSKWVGYSAWCYIYHGEDAISDGTQINNLTENLVAISV